MSPRISLYLFNFTIILLLGFASAQNFGWVLSNLQELNNNEIQMPILLAISHNTDLEPICKDVSDPYSKSYGQYYDLSDLPKLLGTEDNAYIVSDWLKSIGATDIHISKSTDLITAKLSIRIIENILKVKIKQWIHPSYPDKILLRSEEKPVLPSHISNIIDLVSGISDFVYIPFPKKEVSLNKDNIVSSSLKSNHAPSSLPRGSNNHTSSSLGSNYYPPELSGLTIVDSSVSIYLRQKCSGDIYSKDPYPCRDVHAQEDEVSAYTIHVQMTDGHINMTYTAPFVVMEIESISYFKVDIEFPEDSSVIDAYYCAEFLHADLPHCRYWTMGTIHICNSTTAAHQESCGSSDFTYLFTKSIDPITLKSYYNLPSTSNKEGTDRNYQSILALNVTDKFENDALYSPESLRVFFKTFELSPDDDPVDRITIKGPGYPSETDEHTGQTTAFALQYLMGISSFVDTELHVVTQDETHPFDYLLDFFLDFSDRDDVPYVSTLSYSIPEYMLSTDYIHRVNNELLKMCLRGRSIVVSTSDDGCCTLSDTVVHPQCAPYPTFPASSPWVTSVGATTLLLSKKEEIISSLEKGVSVTSGGGFARSEENTMPWYQKEEVSSYLDIVDHSKIDEVIPNRRAYPDIAATGHNIQIARRIVNPASYIERNHGSAPIIAGIFSLINSERFANSKVAIGFANPLIYSAYRYDPSIFYDITTGDISCGNSLSTSPLCCELGYPAVEGYDPSNGLGSIMNYDNLLDFAMSFNIPSDEKTKTLSTTFIVLFVMGCVIVGLAVAYYINRKHYGVETLSTPLLKVDGL